MNRTFPFLAIGLLFITNAAAQHAAPPLIVVEDHGGVSALPYYRALNLLPDTVASEIADSSAPSPAMPNRRVTDADMLPVHSALWTPDDVPRRVIRAPGLSPVFVIGDDTRSRAWLSQHLSTLRELGAVGLVVNVESPPALAALRRLAPGVTLAPTPGDDLARRLGLHHYPVLITATGIDP